VWVEAVMLLARHGGGRCPELPAPCSHRPGLRQRLLGLWMLFNPMSRVFQVYQFPLQPAAN